MGEQTAKTSIYKWNAGGWFGAQIGSTLWILILGSLIAPADMSLAAIIFALFWAPNILGVALWMWRDKISAYAALQGLIAFIGVCAFAAVHLIEQSGQWHLVSGVALNDEGLGAVSAGAMKMMIVIGAPALMVMVHLRKRQGETGANDPS